MINRKAKQRKNLLNPTGSETIRETRLQDLYCNRKLSIIALLQCTSIVNNPNT